MIRWTCEDIYEYLQFVVFRIFINWLLYIHKYVKENRNETVVCKTGINIILPQVIHGFN